MLPFLQALVDNLRANIAEADFLVGIVGFALTLFGLWRARTAFNAAQTASDRTLNTVRDRVTIGDIQQIQGTLKETQTALRGKRWETAAIKTQEARARLSRLKPRAPFLVHARQTDLETAVFVLTKLQKKLEAKIEDPDTPLSAHKANIALAELICSLSVWTEYTTFASAELPEE